MSTRTLIWRQRAQISKRKQNSCYNMIMKYQDIITIEPGKRGGKPSIRGMRITVYDVLSYLAAGMTHEDILRDFPYLTEEDILASLAYAADRERQVLSAPGNP